MSEEREIKDDIGNYASLEMIKDSDGGKLLLKGLERDIVSSVEEIMAKYKELPHVELMAVIAHLDAKFGVYKAITRSTENKKMARDYLNNILKEKQDG